MPHYYKTIAILACLSILGLSCKKEAGFGGLSTVTGKVYAKDYQANNPTVIEAEGYTANIKVVLAVEGDNRILKETRTDLNGSFEFDELRKGSYLIWTFTDCDKCTNNDSLVIQSFQINSRKEDIELPDFNIEI